MMGAIAVGVDGSEGSIKALQWAAAEAQAHGHTLRVVTAWSMPVTALSPGGLPAPFPIEELEGDARAAQSEAIVKAGVPEDVLLEAGETADLVVISSRGHGGFKGLLLGSVGQQVTGHAKCPVVVVPPPAD
jgi:nucleotide-binding universal stress UspA family protein